MTKTDWEYVGTLVKEHSDKLDFEKQDERENFTDRMCDKITALENREREDFRKASEIAVGAAKTFVQIAIALLVAVVGFFQFAFKDIDDKVIIGLIIAGILTFVSMGAGFMAISKTYKRGEGREKGNEEPWTTGYIKGNINTQALTGLAALIVFSATIVLFGNTKKGDSLRIILPDKSTQAVAPSSSFEIKGEWSNLSISQPGNFTLQIEPVPIGETRKVKFELE